MPSERTLEHLKKLRDPYGPAFDPLLDELAYPGLRPMHYDRDGEPITMRQWSLLHNDRDYAQLRVDHIGAYCVSTVWLGIDHSFGFGDFKDAPPIIFETMVFAEELSYHPPTEATEFNGIPFPAMPGFHYHESFDQRRYTTEEQAIAGHEEICDEIRLIMDATGDIDPRVEGEDK